MYIYFWRILLLLHYSLLFVVCYYWQRLETDVNSVSLFTEKKPRYGSAHSHLSFIFNLFAHFMSFIRNIQATVNNIQHQRSLLKERKKKSHEENHLFEIYYICNTCFFPSHLASEKRFYHKTSS